MRTGENIFGIVVCGFLIIGTSVAGCSFSSAVPDEQVSGGQSSAEDRNLYFAVIEGLNSAGQSQAALAYLDDFDKRYPGSLRSKILRGHADIAIGNEREASAIFQEVVRAGAVSAGHEGLGKICAKRRDWSGASRHFAVSVDAEPANAKLLNNLGYALLMSGRPDDAWSTLARASQLKPKDKQIRNNLLLAEYWGNGRARAIARVQAIGDETERNAVWRFISRWKVSSSHSSG